MSIKNIIKKIPFSKKIYYALKAKTHFNPRAYSIDEICDSLLGKKIENELKRKRINLLIPSINNSDIYGGLYTVLNFFIELVDKNGYDARIIITNRTIDKLNNAIPKNYKLVKIDEESYEKHQIIDATIIKNKKLCVAKDDVFLLSIWWTYYKIQKVLEFQKQSFGCDSKLLYFIQDYEPGFYQWSSLYHLADCTYRLNSKIIAIINSEELYEYFKSNNYHFYKQYYFNLILNKELKNKLIMHPKNIIKQKQILIYGRPYTKRNAFELILSALLLWANKYTKSQEWRIISVGEKYPNIHLNSHTKIESLGKLSLDDYSKELFNSSVGVSLMMSPHPSYPPLEMSSFGIKTITNTFLTKKIVDENIFSLQCCTPDKICEKLIELCENYKKDVTVNTNNRYIEGKNQFKSIIDALNKELI